MNYNRKGSYGYDTKHSIYFNEYHSKKTETDVGVGTRQNTLKRCGIVKPSKEQIIDYTSKTDRQCESGTCPWR